MHTKDLLADELAKIGLTELSLKARTGYYDDFLSPLPTPLTQLVCDLEKANTPKALGLRDRVIDGEFDATQKEAEDWGKSAEGQEAFESLAAGQRLGDAPIEQAHRAKMNELAAFLDHQFNGDAKGGDKKIGFVMMVFEYGEDSGRCNFISNGANRQDIVAMMKELIARFEGQPEQAGHA